MSWPVYSTLFLNANVTSIGSALAARYTVPAGKVAVIRSIDAFMDTVGTVLVGDFTGSTSYLFFSTKDVPEWHVQSWEGHQVFPAASVLGAQYVDGACRVRASGFLLSAP